MVQQCCSYLQAAKYAIHLSIFGSILFFVSVSLLRERLLERRQVHNATTPSAATMAMNVSHLPAFTVLMLTYKRNDLLADVLANYAQMSSVTRVILLWHNLGESVPEFPSHIVKGSGKTLIVLEPKSNTLANRWKVSPHLMTEAVLVSDDDTLISENDLLRAFAMWKLLPDRLFGFACRAHGLNPDGSYQYIGATIDGKYSIILPAPMLVHRNYFHMFNNLPSRVFRMIDHYNNCDDIAVNFAVSLKLEDCVGVCVLPKNYKKIDKSGAVFKGLQHTNFHRSNRTRCLNDLVAIYGKMPLQYSDVVITSTKKRP